MSSQFRIDRVVAKLHLRISSHALDAHTHKRVLQMLEEIDRLGLDHLVRAMKGRKVTPVLMLNHSTRTPLEQLRYSEGQELPALASIEGWLDRVKQARIDDVRNGSNGLEANTVHSYRLTSRRFLDGKKTALVAELPVLLAAFRDGAKGRNRAFNYTRNILQSFLRDTVGRNSELWKAVANILPLKVKRGKKRPLSPAEARMVCEALGDCGVMWWTMCCTGMGPKEYFVTPWEVLADRVAIHGTKRDARERIVPLVGTPVRPFMARSTFDKKVRAVAEALGIPFTLYDARRTFLHWCEMARIHGSRITTYAGHAADSEEGEWAGAKGVTGLYLEHPVDDFLKSDAVDLVTYLGGPGPQPVKLVGSKQRPVTPATALTLASAKSRKVRQA